jgi:peptidoglycan hydrolase-like protein with peptidoglycan-binding domain
MSGAGQITNGRTATVNDGRIMSGKSWNAAPVKRPTTGNLVILAVLTAGLLGGTTAFVASRTTAWHRVARAAFGADAAQRRPEGLRVLSVSPSSSADPVTAADPVRVVFSSALAARSPLPTFSPPVAGQWRADGSALVFTPAVPFGPVTEETLRIPAGVRPVTGSALGRPVTSVFQVGGYSTLRLEQLLAQLGYLPLTWAAQNGSTLHATSGSVLTAKHTDSGSSQSGSAFRWQGAYPDALTSQWQPGTPGVILTGAIMAFQSDRGLQMTGTATAGLWQALLAAAASGKDNRHGYTYALVSKALPETLTVWHNGQVVFHGLANTGAPATPTPDGTFPVYLRRPFQVMQGVMPDGTPYADPAQFVSFFNGDYAVHSMQRASYGSPQSLGCVELPVSEAQQVWPYLTYGSLVTISGLARQRHFVITVPGSHLPEPSPGCLSA